MPIQKLCEYIAKGIYNNLENYISEDIDNDILRMEKKLGVIAIYLLLLPILIFTGIYFGVLKEVIISTISLAIIRIWNGGNHFNTPDSCLLVTTGAILVNPLISHNDPPQSFYVAVTLFAIIVNLFLSPYHTKHNGNNIHKIISCAVCILSYFLSNTMLLTFFILSFDLIYRNQRLMRIWRM